MEQALSRKQGRIPGWLIYTFLWLFFLIIPVITNNYGEEGSSARIYYDWLRMLPFLIVFLVNSVILLPRILFRGFTKAYLFILLFTAISVAYLFHLAGPQLYRNDPGLLEQRMLQDPQYGREEMSPGFHPGEVPGRTEIFKTPTESEGRISSSPYRSLFQFVNTFLISLLLAGFNTAIAMTNKWIREEQSRREAEKEHIKTELAFLQNQISPHFFMNTLNNIHALVASDAQLAQDSILKLSALMRYLLYESGRGTTTLRKEAEFLESYVNLMQLRFDENVKIDLGIPSDLPDLTIPPLLYISFIENAFKHGVSNRELSTISFRILHKPGSLEFISVNTIPARANLSSLNRQGGIGLENIKKRLDLIYKDKYQLDIQKSVHEFRVKLIIPV